MKIFAKRTKKAASPPTRGKEGIESNDRNYASDKIVEEELLRKDPGEWNAKERRMVKRYQDRKLQENGASDQTDSSMKNAMKEQDDLTMVEKGTISNDGGTPGSKGNKSNDGSSSDSRGKLDSSWEDSEDNSDEEEKEQLECKKRKTVPGDETNSETSTTDIPKDLDSVGSNLLEKTNSKQRRRLSPMLTRTGDEAVPIDKVREKASAMSQESTGTSKSSNEKELLGKANKLEYQSAEMAAVQKILEGLNSKQRRKLSRRLEREGQSCLAEVKQEAENLLHISTEKNHETKEIASQNEDPCSSGKKRKRARGPVDLSSLTPEERLRREEQKRMQKEAAERRANGEDNSSKFSHPLNSERRRANRRKPKWAPKASSVTQRKIEHNASGYQARKIKDRS